MQFCGSQIINNAVHDSRWITDDGRPNGGYLQIFNNSGISNNQSSIDGIDTPWDAATNSYLRTPGQAFTPSSYTTRYACAYSASGQSASDRMSNGNIYINASGGQGGAGVMYEVDLSGNIIWGPYQAGSQKGFRYECNYPGIVALQSYMNTSTTSCFTSWDCDGQGNCYDPGNGNGQYMTLGACELECFNVSSMAGSKQKLNFYHFLYLRIASTPPEFPGSKLTCFGFILLKDSFLLFWSVIITSLSSVDEDCNLIFRAYFCPLLSIGTLTFSVLNPIKL